MVNNTHRKVFECPTDYLVVPLFMLVIGFGTLRTLLGITSVAALTDNVVIAIAILSSLIGVISPWLIVNHYNHKYPVKHVDSISNDSGLFNGGENHG